jgi:hypothetical protein
MLPKRLRDGSAGELHLAAVPLICFEWHQRPENVLAGHLTWADYKPPERPNAVRVFHHKTGEVVSLPLLDKNVLLFPELTAYLDNLERLGVPIVLMRPKSEGAPARSHFSYAQPATGCAPLRARRILPSAMMPCSVSSASPSSVKPPWRQAAKVKSSALRPMRAACALRSRAGPPSA